VGPAQAVVDFIGAGRCTVVAKTSSRGIAEPEYLGGERSYEVEQAEVQRSVTVTGPLDKALAKAHGRNAVLGGYVELCGGPAPGSCGVELIGRCQTPKGCATSNRVLVLDQRGRRVAEPWLHNARFRLRVRPGTYTVELLANGKQVHGRVVQRHTVTVEAHHEAVVRFLFGIP
jgi:hypothetical protein